ncbi:MAG: hemerythrin domain-containing protein [Pseudomonadota bacterium]
MEAANMLSTNEYSLNNAQMDENHRVFLETLKALEGASKSDFITHFTGLVQHTKEHFEEENTLMESSGFPAIAEHKGEHKRVLGELLQLNERVQKGSIMFARAWINEQAMDWFKLHLSTMDAALATHLSRSNIQEATTSTTAAQEISVKDAEAFINDENVLLLDIRDIYSFKADHIPGAMLVHDDLVSHLIATKQYDRPIIVYCYKGVSSLDLVSMLTSRGYRRCYSLSGGFTEWSKYHRLKKEGSAML